MCLGPLDRDEVRAVLWRWFFCEEHGEERLETRGKKNGRKEGARRPGLDLAAHREVLLALLLITGGDGWLQGRPEREGIQARFLPIQKVREAANGWVDRWIEGRWLVVGAGGMRGSRGGE